MWGEAEAGECVHRGLYEFRFTQSRRPQHSWSFRRGGEAIGTNLIGPLAAGLNPRSDSLYIGDKLVKRTSRVLAGPCLISGPECSRHTLRPAISAETNGARSAWNRRQIAEKKIMR